MSRAVSFCSASLTAEAAEFAEESQTLTADDADLNGFTQIRHKERWGGESLRDGYRKAAVEDMWTAAALG